MKNVFSKNFILLFENPKTAVALIFQSASA